MNIALCGATGRAGSRILSELRSRGHHVLAIVREADALPPGHGVAVAVDDLADPARTAAIVTGTDALVSAYAPPPGNAEELVPVTERLIEAIRLSKVPRLLMVGGAGSLEVAPGVTLAASGKLPQEWMPLAIAHGHSLEVLRESSIDWTSLSPAAYFDPGERTGRYRVGTDNLIATPDGNSRISMEDYAIALVDELDKPAHRRQRFSVGY